MSGNQHDTYRCEPAFRPARRDPLLTRAISPPPAATSHPARRGARRSPPREAL